MTDKKTRVVRKNIEVIVAAGADERVQAAMKLGGDFGV
jgi:hypothetical protein